MSHPVCRSLPYTVADGAHNMAADEVLLETAAAGTASLRFYGWSEATVSLGYFQPASVLSQANHLTSLPFVRRPSGGDTLVHHHELTYALAVPPGRPWQMEESWLKRMHRVIAAALGQWGIPARLHESKRNVRDGILCFRHVTEGDVLVGPAKVVGSAQRRQRRALMQHGGILLARSPHTPMLPGIRELTGHDLEATDVVPAISAELMSQTGWTLASTEWTLRERQRIADLAAAKYSQDAWNRKR